MRRALLALVTLILIHNALALTTITVGDCAKGDYEFNDIYSALREAEDHYDVNIVVCGEQHLDRGITVRVTDLVITGGTIISNEDRIRIYGNDVTLTDMNMINTRLTVVATGDVVLRDLNAALPSGWRYCTEINAEGKVVIDGVYASGCEYGIYVRRADELNVWAAYVGRNTQALRVEKGNVGVIYLNPVERPIIKKVEIVVEKNVPVVEKEYRIPPEMQKELEGCQELVGILQKKKWELEKELRQVKESMGGRSQRMYPDAWTALGIAAIGLAVGYVLGRM